MRVLRKTALLATLALAVTGIAASPTVAQMEFINEATGEHCSPVTYVNHGTGSGGCLWSMVNEGRIEFASPLGMVDCDVSVQGRVGEGGNGSIFAANLFNCSPNMIDECKEEGVADNWSYNWTSEHTQEWAICIVISGFLTVNCHLAGMVYNQISHASAEVSTGGLHKSCEEGGGNSLRGHWLMSTAAPGFEVID